MHHPLLKKLVYRWLRPGPLRQLNAAQHALPDFLVLGAMRSGTTSLHQVLSSHPQVHPGIKKEVHYFDLYHARGQRWYRAHFPHRRALSGAQKRLVTGETSPYYLFHPLAPARAAAALPEVRLIVILRDPVERAHSHYWHGRQNGYESLSFEAALAAESERLAGQQDITQAGGISRPHQLYSYKARGRYLEQIQTWLTYYSPDQLLVLEHEAFFDPISGEDARLFDFLKIESVPKPPERRYNQAQYPRLENHLREQLSAHFKPHNEALFEFLGREMPWKTD
jgi:hypothetical protein